VAFKEQTYEAIDDAVKKQLYNYTKDKREERTLYEKNLRHDRLFGQIPIEDVQEARSYHNADMRAKAEQQAATLAQQDLDRYRLKVFLTIKQAILKQIKDHQLDALIAVLRERKFARIYAQSAGLDVIVRRLATNLNYERERMIERFKLRIYKVRMVGAIRKHIRNRYGPGIGADHDLKIHYGWVRPSVVCGVQAIQGTVKARAQ